MAQQGDKRVVNGVPQIYSNGRWIRDPGGMEGTGGGLSSDWPRRGTPGQASAIAGVLGVTGPTESPAGKAAIDRLQNQADRKACNDSGGFYTMGGGCLTGQEARDRVNEILNNPNSPSVLVQKANAWIKNNDLGGDTDENAVEDTSAVSDADAIVNILSKVPDKLKGVITEDNIIEVLKTLGGIEDPITAIKRGMIAGIEIEFPEDWRDWKVFGTIRIPGVPLPPGIVDVTFRDIEEAVKNVGGTITDFIEGIEDGSSWEKVKDWIRGVWNGATDEDEWGKTIGGFEGYIKGILGDLVGGYIITDIYDEIKGWFEPEAPAIPPGGDDEEDDEDTPKQGDDIANFDYDSDLESDKELDFGGFDDDDDDDTTGGLEDEFGDPEQTDTPVVIPDGDDDDDDDEITLGDPEDDDEEELGGGGGGSFGAGGGGSGLFEGGIRGLSYSPQPLPTVKPPEYVDAMASIGGLIANLSSKNGRNA
jgi:hypothetical protein